MTDHAQAQITHEAFFSLVEAHPDKRFDLIDGELVEVSSKPIHGYLQVRMAVLLSHWLAVNPIGHPHTKVLHVLGGEKFLPVISVNAQKANDQDYFDAPPLLAVEIRSDTQSRAAQRRKSLRYIALGTPAVLLILPNEGIELFTQETGDQPRSFLQGEVVDSIPGFDGLKIDVAALFN